MRSSACVALEQPAQEREEGGPAGGEVFEQLGSGVVVHGPEVAGVESVFAEPPGWGAGGAVPVAACRVEPLAACALPVFGVSGFEAVAGVAGVAGAWFGGVEAAGGEALRAGWAAPVGGGGEEVEVTAGDAVAGFGEVRLRQPSSPGCGGGTRRGGYGR